LFLNFDLFVESVRKIDIRHFMGSKAFLIMAEVQKTIRKNDFRSGFCTNSTADKNERSANAVFDCSSPFQIQLCGVRNDNDQWRTQKIS